MTNLLSALLFAAALIIGLGSASSTTYACSEKSVQADAKDSASSIQLAMDDAEDDSSEDDSSEDDSSEDEY